MANTKITRRNDDNHDDDDNFFLKLKDTLESSMSRHAEHWVKEQDELSEKFDSLQEAYAELVGRLTSVEAKDFGSAVSKIDSSLKKMISLDHRTEGLEELIRKHETTIVDLKEKINRANLIINIAMGFFLSIVVPVLIALVPYIIDLVKQKGQ